ncbi:MAG: hypothetical protein M3169_08095 [Candidatus Eremiobacteraeota bacterium]|nr:hypothetical protein [Candidatus Eremiobacteraeota bacterium]
MNGFFRRVAGSVCCLVVSATLVACSVRTDKQPSRVESAFGGFDQFRRNVVLHDVATRAVASKINERYRALILPYQTTAAMAKLKNEDVALLFQAAYVAFFYTISPGPLDDMQLDLAELHRRGIGHSGDDAKVYASLIEIRYFGQARAFAKLHPRALAETVPVVTDDHARQGPTAFYVEAGGSKLERRSVDLRNRRIVVVSSPLCHFSQRAMRSIESDAELRPVFHDRAVWVVPPDQSTPFTTVAKWNRLHLHESMAVAYRREEWPMIDLWETPVFYFLRDGRVVSKVVGWPIAGRKAEIRRSLRLAGLL